MKALIKKEAAPGLTLGEVPIPEYGINDVLIKIQKTAICGTDVHIYNWDEWSQKTIRTPMVIGHEFVGHVAAFGSNVHDVKIGELVSGEGHIVCGRCRTVSPDAVTSATPQAESESTVRAHLRNISASPSRTSGTAIPIFRPIISPASTRSAMRRIRRSPSISSEKTSSSPARGRSASWRRQSQNTRERVMS